MGQLRTANKRRKRALIAVQKRANSAKIVAPASKKPAPAAK